MFLRLVCDYCLEVPLKAKVIGGDATDIAEVKKVQREKAESASDVEEGRRELRHLRPRERQLLPMKLLPMPPRVTCRHQLRIRKARHPLKVPRVVRESAEGGITTKSTRMRKVQRAENDQKAKMVRESTTEEEGVTETRVRRLKLVELPLLKERPQAEALPGSF